MDKHRERQGTAFFPVAGLTKGAEFSEAESARIRAVMARVAQATPRPEIADDWTDLDTLETTNV